MIQFSPKIEPVEVEPTKEIVGSPTWAKAKLHYIEQNLNPDRDEPYTLKDLAKDFNLNYGSLRNRCSQEAWNSELEVLKQRKMAEATKRVQDMQVVSEVEIRMRQAQFARLAQNKAILRIQSIDPTTLTVRDAIALLQLGLMEERRALGMPDEPSPPDESDEKKNARDKQSIMSEAMKIIDNMQPAQEMKDVN